MSDDWHLSIPCDANKQLWLISCKVNTVQLCSLNCASPKLTKLLHLCSALQSVVYKAVFFLENSVKSNYKSKSLELFITFLPIPLYCSSQIC